MPFFSGTLGAGGGGGGGGLVVVDSVAMVRIRAPEGYVVSILPSHLSTWSAQFWSWLHSKRRGLQPLQVAVGVRTSRAERILGASVEQRLEYLEPMPIVV